MNYLIKATNIYRVSTVKDALELREELSKSNAGELIAFSYTTKYLKQKGEIVGEYQLCKATFDFTPEKEPETCVKVQYSI